MRTPRPSPPSLPRSRLATWRLTGEQVEMLEANVREMEEVRERVRVR